MVQLYNPQRKRSECIIYREIGKQEKGPWTRNTGKKTNMPENALSSQRTSN